MPNSMLFISPTRTKTWRMISQQEHFQGQPNITAHKTFELVSFVFRGQTKLSTLFKTCVNMPTVKNVFAWLVVVAWLQTEKTLDNHCASVLACVIVEVEDAPLFPFTPSTFSVSLHDFRCWASCVDLRTVFLFAGTFAQHCGTRPHVQSGFVAGHRHGRCLRRQSMSDALYPSFLVSLMGALHRHLGMSQRLCRWPRVFCDLRWERWLPQQL